MGVTMSIPTWHKQLAWGMPAQTLYVALVKL